MSRAPDIWLEDDYRELADSLIAAARALINVSEWFAIDSSGSYDLSGRNILNEELYYPLEAALRALHHAIGQAVVITHIVPPHFD